MRTDQDKNIQNYSCIFLNMEVNVNNINSSLEHLGMVPRYYETETLRLVESIRDTIKEDIKIFIILFKPYKDYNQDIISKLEELNVTFLIPQIKKSIKREIDKFKSGFWYIPLTGLLIENTKKIINGIRNKSQSHLLTLDNKFPDIPEYGLKLDSDMIMIKNPFNHPDIAYSYIENMPLVGQYDKDFGEDCKERLKYGIYDTIPMSNTCLVFSNLNSNIYFNWWICLIEEDSNYDDLFEEVSFDLRYPIPKKAVGIKNFQIGENYLCAKDLSAKELQDIYFYHGKLNHENEIHNMLPITTKIKFYQKMNKQYKA